MLRVRSSLRVLAAVAGLVTASLAPVGTIATARAQEARTDVIKVMGNSKPWPLPLK
jgi:hypothetical protein